jgi:hypothetical protein
MSCYSSFNSEATDGVLSVNIYDIFTINRHQTRHGASGGGVSQPQGRVSSWPWGGGTTTRPQDVARARQRRCPSCFARPRHVVRGPRVLGLAMTWVVRLHAGHSRLGAQCIGRQRSAGCAAPPGIVVWRSILFPSYI